MLWQVSKFNFDLLLFPELLGLSNSKTCTLYMIEFNLAIQQTSIIKVACSTISTDQLASRIVALFLCEHDINNDTVHWLIKHCAAKLCCACFQEQISSKTKAKSLLSISLLWRCMSAIQLC